MSSVQKCNSFEIRENENNMKNNVLYTDIVMNKVEKKKINDLNLNFNRVEVGKLINKKCQSSDKVFNLENKGIKSSIPNVMKGNIKNNFSSFKKKVKKKVNFPEKYMIFIIEVESYKKYNYLNTNRDLLKKPTSCKCNIY